MAMMEIRIKDKKFIRHNDVNVEVFEPNYVEGNCWKCEIDLDGNVTCLATKTYFDVKRQIEFSIKNGHAELKLQIGEDEESVIKSFAIKQWPLDGVLRLSDGYIDKRKAYFREIEFQKFLNEYGITAVRYETANAVYKLKRKVEDGNIVFEETVETDGKREQIDFRAEPHKGDTYSMYRVIKVTNATWTIKTSKRFGVIEQRVIYTTEKPQTIKRLPKLK